MKCGAKWVFEYLAVKYLQCTLEVSTPPNLVFGIWEFDIDLRVALFLGLVVTSVNTLLVFGTYWD